ncbi:MAG: (Fe-S)-binding protein [Candidatus Thorarchaeota archaeon]
MRPEEIAEQVRMCAACPKMCRHVCPTFFAWRSDSPTPHGRALLIHQDLIGVRPLDERGIEVLYQCLECSACLTWCVPGIDIASIVELVRARIVEEGRAPERLTEIAASIHEHHNPYGEDHNNRNSWLKTTGTGEKRVIYFTGCTTAYREKEIAESTVQLLERLGYSVTITPDEWCCGSPLLRTGFVEEARESAHHNVEVLNALDADTIMVTCPGCYRTLTKDYPELGLTLNKPVVHLTQFLDSQLKDLPTGVKGTVTYHDPCHLGRHSGIYDEPRRVIDQVSETPLVEMERTRDNAMCCGNGAGLRTLFPEQSRKIGRERIEQSLRTGADYLVTACPFCKNMLKSQAQDQIKVLDLPEYLMLADGHKRSID